MTPEPQEAPIPQAVRLQAIRDSFRQAMPAIISGEDEPTVRVWGKHGALQDYWDRDGKTPGDALKLLDQGFVCEAILLAVCRATDLPKEIILGKRRGRDVVRPRQVACFLMTRLSTRSLPEIGRFMGGRDHTTVMHANRAVRERLDGGDELTCTAYRDVKRILGI